MHAVSDNGKNLWRSLMIERQRILTEMPSLAGKYLQRNIHIPDLLKKTHHLLQTDLDAHICDQMSFNTQLKLFLSRRNNTQDL